jgi:chromosome partitioning protein
LELKIIINQPVRPDLKAIDLLVVEGKSMYIIAVSNEKGGVAKTTTTISLGATLAESGQRVLLVDLDAQGNLTLALGAEPSKVNPTIANTLLEGLPLKKVIQKSNIDHLDFVSSNHEIGKAERFLALQPKYECILKNSLNTLITEYDIVLMDCPPFLGVVTLNAMVAANLLLIPTQPEYFSIYALKNLMGWVRHVRKDFNPSLLYRLVITMSDRRNRIHRILSEQLRENFTDGILNTVIETDTKLRESVIVGMPITQHAPKSRSAVQYHELSLEILKYVKETSLQPA